MSSSDYIMAKKSKVIKNLAKPLSNGKYAAFSYEHKYLQTDLDIVMCDDNVYFKTMPIPSQCPFKPNSEEGRYTVTVNEQPIYPNSDIGLRWKAVQGTFDNSGNGLPDPMIFSYATPFIGANGISSGITQNIVNLYSGTQYNIYDNNNPLPLQDINTLVGTQNNFSVEWTGYFLAPFTGTVIFKTQTKSKDTSLFWIGDKALSNYTVINADLALIRNETSYNANSSAYDSVFFEQTFSYQVVNNVFYPIRIQYYDTNTFNSNVSQAFSFSVNLDGHNFVSGDTTFYYSNNYVFSPCYLPLITTPSVKPIIETPCEFKRASIYASCNAPFHRRWNRKNQNILRIKASTTFNI